MKLYLTAEQITSLETGIYNSLMDNPENGMGEMGEARDEAERIVREWMEGNDIEEQELPIKEKTKQQVSSEWWETLTSMERDTIADKYFPYPEFELGLDDSQILTMYQSETGRKESASKTDRELALEWWRNLNKTRQQILTDKYGSAATGREIELIYLKEKQEAETKGKASTQENLTDRLLDNPQQDEEDFNDLVDAAYDSISDTQQGEELELIPPYPLEISWNTFNGGEDHGLYAPGELDLKGYQIAIVNSLPTLSKSSSEELGKAYARLFASAPTLKKDNEELKAICKKYMNRAWDAETENKRLSHLVKGLTETLKNVLDKLEEDMK